MADSDCNGVGKEMQEQENTQEAEQMEEEDDEEPEPQGQQEEAHEQPMATEDAIEPLMAIARAMYCSLLNDCLADPTQRDELLRLLNGKDAAAIGDLLDEQKGYINTWQNFIFRLGGVI